MMKTRANTAVCAYLILRLNDQVLLSLRQNTGYCDGMWSLVAGHVEEGEPATLGMAREAREEIGIEISPCDLKVVHVMHRQSDRLNIDVFFECRVWHGTIQNLEPEKCERLEFFSLNALPGNSVDYNAKVLKGAGEFYSEWGWG